MAGPGALDRSYAAAHALGHRWHEFGDFNLLLRPSREAGRRGAHLVPAVQARPSEALSPELSAVVSPG